MLYEVITDNQVQIAHNVVIGANSLIVAQVGLAGSCSLGRNVVLGGKVGVNGHIHLDDQVMARITSYNVCYTKLLRAGEIFFNSVS